MDTATDTAEADQIVREYRDYLDDDADQGVVTQLVKDLIAENKPRLTVNLNHLRKKNPKRAKQLMNNAQSELMLFERALREYVSVIDAAYARERGDEARMGFVGVFGGHHFSSPRALGASQLGSLIAVDGVVTQCGLVRPKLVRSVHYCAQTGKRMERRYADPRSLANSDENQASAYPVRDEQGNLLETEFGLSEYRDQQAFTLHELAERAPTGQLARAIECVAEGDLVDLVKPGDRIQVVGVYRALPLMRNALTSAQFRTVLIVTNIVHIQRDERASLSKDDVAIIRKFAKQQGKNVIEVLTRSIAPSIHGHEFVKEAILCQLLGGVEKRLANGTRIRGDVNVLLVGDPSVAKSQLLRFVFETASRAIATTGRGSTGVGLTAAVTNDPETGERRLEAGATVRGDRGVVCIDEFDKMTDTDRTALHEVMEQGRVTIAKAGIHAHLNARCAILAAANPIFGRYDVYKTPTENIGLQDSLLSRFDLLFILLDKVDPDADREIAEHVLGMHRYRAPNEREDVDAAAQNAPDVFASAIEQRAGDADVEADADASLANLLDETQNDLEVDAVIHRDGDIFETYEQPTVTIEQRSRARRAAAKQQKILNVRFLRKFVALAKMMEPQLTKKASSYIAEKYTELRAREQDSANAEANMARTQPVTARTLETLIRLSAAFAKARLSAKIDEEDAERAFTLLNYALYKEVLEKPRRSRKRQREDDGGEEVEEEDDDNMDDEHEEEAQRIIAKSKRARVGGEASARPRAQAQDEAVVEVTQDVYDRVLPAVSSAFRDRHVTNLQLTTLVEYVMQAETQLSQEQVRASLRRLEDENKIMIADGEVFLI